MNNAIRDSFLVKWRKYFGNADLPVAFCYNDGEKEISFSAPLAKFLFMIENMDESFLITKSWRLVKQRLAG